MTARNRALAILGYHKVGLPAADGWESWYLIPEEIFVRQLNLLNECGWTVIDLKTFVAGLADPDRLPERAVLLTFNDGYLQFLDWAIPCLVSFGFPAVMFVSTDHVGGRNEWDANTDQPLERICG